MKPLPGGRIITSFAGLRAHGETGDFIIGEAEGAPLFYDLAGIESPGLSSAPAIGEMTAAWAEQALGLQKKEHVIEKRNGIPHFAELPFEEKQKLIEKNPLYGQIVCRCETVTEGRVKLSTPSGVRSEPDRSMGSSAARGQGWDAASPASACPGSARFSTERQESRRI